MTDMQDLEEEEVPDTTAQETADFNKPDFLQERSDIIASLSSEEQKPETIKSYDNLLPSERHDIAAKDHLKNVGQKLAEMRERGDYGEPIEVDGKRVQLDMEFLADQNKLPPEVVQNLESEEK